MLKSKRVITLVSQALSLGGYEYRVKSLKNTLEPGLGTILSQKEAQELINEAQIASKGLEVNIVGEK